MLMNHLTLLSMAPIKKMEKTKQRSHGVSFGLGEAGYDIRIQQTVRFRRAFFGLIKWVEIEDPVNGTKEKHWGTFALASSIEEFSMPPYLVGVVHDKSTWARRTLSVFNTVIEPGWKGFLTLELVHHGRKELTIPAGAGIAQVLFHRTSDYAMYKGKYSGQPNKPVSAIDS